METTPNKKFHKNKKRKNFPPTASSTPRPKTGDAIALNIGNREKRTEFPDIHIPLRKNVIDKSPEFNNVMSREWFQTLEWDPYTIGNRWVGMISQPIQFRRGMKSSQRWKTLFTRLLDMEDDVYLSNFVDHSPDILSVHIIVFEPKFLQIIDGMIGDALKVESKELMKAVHHRADMPHDDAMDLS